MMTYAVSLGFSLGKITRTSFQNRQCVALYERFSLADAQGVVAIERTVNHDLKALELFLISSLKRSHLFRLIPYINLGIGSEDINSMALAILLIADGGTNYPGDMTKALAAEASTVMITEWLADTDESPGSIILRKGQKYKVHRGAASFSAVAPRKLSGVSGQLRKELAEEEINKELEEIVPEGVESFVPYKGPAKDVIYQLVGAVKSGMNYCNARTTSELWKQAQFVRMTSSGLRESAQHNVEEM